MKKVLFFVFGFWVIGAASASTVKQADGVSLEDTPSATVPLSQKIDCSEMKGLKVKPGQLSLIVADDTSTRDLETVGKLSATVCKAADAALHVAKAEGKSASWVNGLEVHLVDAIGDATDQAAFKRSEVFGTVHRQIQVASGMFGKYSEEELLFSLGHELGHGVHQHAERKRNARLAGIAGAAGGAVVAIVAKKRITKVLGAGVAAYAATKAVCGPSKASLEHEHEADIFGVKVLAETGVPLKKAQAVAIALLAQHEEPAQNCLNATTNVKKVVDDNSHPDTATRIVAVEKMKAPGK